MGENKLEAIDARLEEQQIFGSKHCPTCSHKLDGKPEWFGLPPGVKFDPSDQELIEPLEAKVEAKDVISHLWKFNSHSCSSTPLKFTRRCSGL